jgi:hypothetical protein
MKSILVGAIFLLCFSASVVAAPCTVEVENESAKISGNRFYTSWHVRRSGGSQIVKVYFEYRIQYRNKRGTTLAESGIFNEYVRGQSGQFTKESASINDPVEILSVEYNRVDCHD